MNFNLHNFKKSSKESPNLAVFWFLVIAVFIVVSILFCLVSFCKKIGYAALGNTALNNYLLYFESEYCENSFFNIQNEDVQGLKTIITDNVDYVIKDASSNDGTINFVAKIKVPNLAASISKRYPQLFTYSNVNYANSRLNTMTENEYVKEICDALRDELNSGSLNYCVEIPLTAVKDGNGDWVLNSYVEIENHLLGNIYSYQNNDVSFLTFKDLINPSGPTIKTSSVELSTLFEDAAAETTFSSPDIPIPMGDLAKFYYNSPGDTSKIYVMMSITGAKFNNDGTMTVTFKGYVPESETPVTISPTVFELYGSNVLSSGTSNSVITLTSEPSSFDIQFSSQSEIIVFKSDSSSYFSSIKS